MRYGRKRTGSQGRFDWIGKNVDHWFDRRRGDEAAPPAGVVVFRKGGEPVHGAVKVRHNPYSKSGVRNYHRVGRVLGFFSSRRNWDSPTPLAAGGCGPPLFGPGGRANSLAREELGESQFRRLEKKLSTLPTLW
jgi:hypothetical protein